MNKIMIASDLHGSAYYTKQTLNAFFQEGASKLLLLGDILYHGPRNDLPKEYAPKEVLAMLNQHRRKILCVRGNCDTEVDQMVLEFPCLADYAIYATDNTVIYATHGHIYNEKNLPPLCAAEILLHGHTHIPTCNVHEDYVCLNPGSVSIPKEGSPHSYMIFDGNMFYWKTLNGTEYHRFAPNAQNNAPKIQYP